MGLTEAKSPKLIRKMQSLSLMAGHFFYRQTAIEFRPSGNPGGQVVRSIGNAGPGTGGEVFPGFSLYSNGVISRATVLTSLMMILTAGPAVSL